MAVPKKTTKPVTVKYVLDCSIPVQDNILDPASLEKFLIDNIKVDGKTGNFESRSGGEVTKRITVSRDKARICIDAVSPFKKRYIKYLTKRYLKKQQIRDFLRVISNNPNSYHLKYYRSAGAATETA